MSDKLFLIVIFIFGSYAYAQQNDYKVTLNDNYGSYSGGWKKDTTHGKDNYRRADGTYHEERGKNHKYQRKRLVPSYQITNSRYVARSTIRKSINSANEVRIKIMQNGVENTDIEDFSLAFDSGIEYRMSNIYGIQNASFPLYVKVTYRSWNRFRAVQFDVTFEFTINEPGTWDVTIFN
jgi:hypothetical protein